MSNYEAAEKINEGFRLRAPSKMPPVIIPIMESCWKEKTSERPEFVEIHELLHRETIRLTR